MKRKSMSMATAAMALIAFVTAVLVQPVHGQDVPPVVQTQAAKVQAAGTALAESGAVDNARGTVQAKAGELSGQAASAAGTRAAPAANAVATRVAPVVQAIEATAVPRGWGKRVYRCVTNRWGKTRCGMMVATGK